MHFGMLQIKKQHWQDAEGSSNRFLQIQEYTCDNVTQ